jgi:hypothetical protein
MNERFVPMSATMRDPSFGVVVKMDVDSAIMVDQTFYLLEERVKKTVEDKDSIKIELKRYKALYGDLSDNQPIIIANDDPTN